MQEEKSSNFQYHWNEQESCEESASSNMTGTLPNL